MTNPGPIHEKAVAMIQSALYGRYEARVRAPGVGQNPVYVRLHPSQEEFSGNIAEGAVKVKVPGEWDSVGGVIPDLILYKADDTPVRIIEVIDTSAPTEAKREKLDRLVRRGVDVVEIEVHTTDGLLHLLKHGLRHSRSGITYPPLAAPARLEATSRYTRRQRFTDTRAQLKTC